MIAVFDIGNTNIVFGVYNEKELVFVSRMKTEIGRMEDQYAVEISQIMALHGQKPACEGGVVCSVVPALTDILARAVRRCFGFDPIVVGPGIKTGLDIKIDNPSQLGADMVASAVGVLASYTPPAIIFDLGTATKASVIHKNGSFMGGLIMPGIGTSLEALSTKTAQLPQINLQKPPFVVGTNTLDCMRSGIINGAAAMVDGVVDRIEDEIGSTCSRFLTGGLSELIVSSCRHEYIHLPNLILEGLRILFEKNR